MSFSSNSSSCRSSYSSGTASIIVHNIQTPPRTTSLQFRQLILQSPPSMFEDEFEEIDLAETVTELKTKSSLEYGKASIIHPKNLNTQRFSIRLFKWKKNKVKFDDGKAELIYRGIPVKEIISTLDPMVLTNC
ncbi:hypothetical protein INT47_008442 [Mucor saturninus]|uniref:Uncharacterized protein n=1 Tax=Mucor saturninus TaxID=64648 RepID=A0A8H7RA53_9FUNG|nr:hypothetical protein INT47_008442 [Mucor saturninus]